MLTLKLAASMHVKRNMWSVSMPVPPLELGLVTRFGVRFGLGVSGLDLLPALDFFSALGFSLGAIFIKRLFLRR